MGTQAQAYQFRDVFDQIFTFKGTYDPANVATGLGTQVTQTFTVPGVALGDIVLGVSFSLSTGGLVFNGAVTAANTVTVTVMNNTAGAVDLASGTILICAGRPNASAFV